MEIEISRLITQAWQSKSKILHLTSNTQSAHPILAIFVGVVVLSLSLALLPFIERSWRATGDEPHYLLAAHSLIYDWDFDLTNNYQQLDYLAFYYSKNIIPQVRLSPAGQQILDHHLGLPVLIAPAYALAGRLGVLAFQVLLGGILAMLTYKLSLLVSSDEKGALWATLAVTLTPLLFFYQYLIYPEFIGAFLTTLVVYYAVRSDHPTPMAVILVILSLLTLPWLNRRFIPLAILLAALIAWAWRKRGDRGQVIGDRQQVVDNPISSLTPIPQPPSPIHRSQFTIHNSQFIILFLIPLVVSIALLLWFNSRFYGPTTVDITAPDTASLLWERLARGVGWLVDQQRGLFIYAPVYILAGWGAPFLISHSLSRRSRHWFVLLPFLLSLGITAAAGGFWVAWEVGPRFLVVALPTLAPLLALAWRHYNRQKAWLCLAFLLLALSLTNSWVILQNPELPYKSSLPLYYTSKLGFQHLSLTDLLPDLAGYERISPDATTPSDAQVVEEKSESAWLAEPGNSIPIIRSYSLPELPAGHYRLTWLLHVAPGLPPDTPLLRISIKTSGGGQIFNQTLTAADLPSDGSYGWVQYAFLNPNVDRWRTPLILNVVSTGATQIWAKDLLFEPDPFYGWWLPYLALAFLGSVGLLTWYHRQKAASLPLNQKLTSGWSALNIDVQKNFPQPFWIGIGKHTAGDFFPLFLSPNSLIPAKTFLEDYKNLVWGFVVFLPVASIAWTVYQSTQSSWTYDAGALDHFVGRAIADPQAADGQGWLVDPRLDPPQKAVYGPFDIYDPGVYRVTFRIKLPEPAKTEQELARLQIAATANFDKLLSQSLHPEHFVQPNLYHDFVLTVNNPRRQALSFEVYYLGVTPLVIDQVTISRVVGDREEKTFFGGRRSLVKG